MTSKEKPKDRPKDRASAVTSIYTFSDVVDSACEGLAECHVKYSIRRIHEMEELLCGLEQELEDFLFMKDRTLE